ncbi:MAG: tyrosine-type recombinase/integrase [Mycobacterium sp.]
MSAPGARGNRSTVIARPRRYGAKVQKITPHDLRHTCASISISSGANVLALSRMLGDQSAKITLDTYADLFDTDLDAVAEALDLPKVCPNRAQPSLPT